MQADERWRDEVLSGFSRIFGFKPEPDEVKPDGRWWFEFCGETWSIYDYHYGLLLSTGKKKTFFRKEEVHTYVEINHAEDYAKIRGL